MTDQCSEVIEGPRVPGTRSARMWRRRCQGRPMRDRAELIGHVTGKCFQHQPQRVRDAVYRLARERRERRG